ncbi:MAG TPA: hypothetical protein VIY48_11240 [Candidatus Paceibacterota bacterium]
MNEFFDALNRTIDIQRAMMGLDPLQPKCPATDYLAGVAELERIKQTIKAYTDKHGFDDIQEYLDGIMMELRMEAEDE